MKKLLTYFLFLIIGCTSFVAQAQDTLAVQPDSATVDSTASIKLNSKIVPFEELFSMGKIVSSIIVLIFAFLVNRFITFLLGKLAENQAAYRLLIKRLIPFLNVILWSMALFIVIGGIINPPVETILTVGASIGIAVGFAAQDILKNIL